MTWREEVYAPLERRGTVWQQNKVVPYDKRKWKRNMEKNSAKLNTGLTWH